MSDANRTKLSFVAETTLGTTPATPAWKQLRITRSGLTYRPITVQSNELASDRQVTDLIRVGQEAGGSFDAEFSFANADPLLESAFFSAWTQMPYRYNNGTADSIITDVSATVVTTSNPAAEATGQGTFAVGHLVRHSGFTTAGNNGLFRISAATATTYTTTGLTIEASPPGTARTKVVGIEGASADISAQAGATNSLTTSALNWTTLGIVAGMWLKVGGAAAGTQFATAANNDWVRVSAVTSTVLTLDRVPSGWTTDTGTSKTIRLWVGDYLRNGTTKKSFSFEQQYQDLTSPEYDVFSGMLANSFSLQADAQAIKSLSLEFQGLSATNGTTRFTGSTDTATDYLGAVPRTGDVFNTSSNVARLAEGGSAITGSYVLALSVALNNNLRRQNAVGSLASVGMGAGRAVVTGNLNTYYGSNAIRTKLLNGTATSLDARFADPNGTRAYVLDMPRVKLTDGSPEGIQSDSDRTINMAFQALKDSTLGYTIQLQRFEEFA